MRKWNFKPWNNILHFNNFSFWQNAHFNNFPLHHHENFINLPFLCDLHCWRHPFSRSYRVNLPSSLAMIHSSTSGYSPWLPVSVCGTGTISICLEGFLGSLFTLSISSAEASEYCWVRQKMRICLHLLYLHLSTPYSVRARSFHSSFTSSLNTVVLEY